MKNWTKNATLPQNVNEGKQYKDGDKVFAQDINSCINNGFYSVDTVDALKNALQNTIVSVSGSQNPNGTMVVDLVEKKTLLSLQLPKGDKGEQGPAGPTGPAGQVPSNVVTTNGDQIINGNKTFNNEVNAGLLKEGGHRVYSSNHMPYATETVIGGLRIKLEAGGVLKIRSDNGSW